MRHRLSDLKDDARATGVGQQMRFRRSVRDQIALLNEGRPLEAFDRYFDDDGVMLDNDKPFGRGKAACRAKQEPFISKARSIVGNITRCSLDVEKTICVFRNQSTFVDESGKRIEIDGIHWQRWSRGKIVEERYYRDQIMAERIAEGILEQGEELSDQPAAASIPKAIGEDQDVD